MSYSTEKELAHAVRAATGCPEGNLVERIQSLWSGYGAIFRFETGQAERPSLVVKQVSPPTARRHPRGWASDRGHQRKLRSYDVEQAFYRDFALRCAPHVRVPRAHLLEKQEGSWLFVLEDLDAAGYPARRYAPSELEIDACLRWLAHFHASFLHDPGDGLWEVGSYWHLATRPDELRAMRDEKLRRAAPALDERLGSARYLTLVHGDAKVENFCFPTESHRYLGGPSVAAVDFQYVGRGVGVKDVAYFLSSCLDQNECLERADGYVDLYFTHLRSALSEYGREAESADVEAEWRELYPVAWADFLRFLLGWAPGHHKIHGYSEKMTAIALADLG